MIPLIIFGTFTMMLTPANPLFALAGGAMLYCAGRIYSRRVKDIRAAHRSIEAKAAAKDLATARRYFSA